MTGDAALVVLATADERQAADDAGLRLKANGRRVQLLAYYPARERVGIVDRGSALQVRPTELAWNQLAPTERNPQ